MNLFDELYEQCQYLVDKSCMYFFSCDFKHVYEDGSEVYNSEYSSCCRQDHVVFDSMTYQVLTADFHGKLLSLKANLGAYTVQWLGHLACYPMMSVIRPNTINGCPLFR